MSGAAVGAAAAATAAAVTAAAGVVLGKGADGRGRVMVAVTACLAAVSASAADGKSPFESGRKPLVVPFVGGAYDRPAFETVTNNNQPQSATEAALPLKQRHTRQNNSRVTAAVMPSTAAAKRQQPIAKQLCDAH